jgi:anti-sigma factor RsiW
VTCQEFVELVTDYFEDRLPAEDRARFVRHLEVCEHCTRYMAQLRTTINTLGRIEPEQISPDARDALLDAFRDWKSGRAA